MEDDKKYPGSFAVIPKDDHALIEVVTDDMGIQFEINSVKEIESLIIALEKSKDNITENTLVFKFGMAIADADWQNWKRSHKWK